MSPVGRYSRVPGALRYQTGLRLVVDLGNRLAAVVVDGPLIGTLQEGGSAAAERPGVA